MVNLLVRGALGTALALGLATGLGACNTMEGVGKAMAEGLQEAFGKPAEEGQGEAP